MPRRRGRPRKSKTLSETPVVKSMVRYFTRNNNAGYKPLALADTRKPRSVAAKATPPSVLQIKEMQRIGVEECQEIMSVTSFKSTGNRKFGGSSSHT
jgi:hypothetical protein